MRDADCRIFNPFPNDPDPDAGPVAGEPVGHRCRGGVPGDEARPAQELVASRSVGLQDRTRPLVYSLAYMNPGALGMSRIKKDFLRLSYWVPGRGRLLSRVQIRFEEALRMGAVIKDFVQYDLDMNGSTYGLTKAEVVQALGG